MNPYEWHGSGRVDEFHDLMIYAEGIAGLDLGVTRCNLILYVWMSNLTIYRVEYVQVYIIVKCNTNLVNKATLLIAHVIAGKHWRCSLYTQCIVTCCTLQVTRRK